MSRHERPEPLPCAVITGALGSGKTTVIRELMARPEMSGTALIVNEFGEIGLDHLMMASAVESTLLMENGCLCCSLRGDLVDTILQLFSAVERGEMRGFERILIETTGLADPIPILHDLSTAPALKDRVRPACTVTTVDALLGPGNDPVSLRQIAQADICILTKADLADELVLDQVREKVQQVNPLASTLVRSAVGLPSTERLFSTSSILSAGQAASAPEEGHQDRSTTHGGVSNFAVTLDRPLPWRAFRDWIDLVYSLQAARILRMKGILWVEERDAPLLLQAVGPVVSPLEIMQDWPLGEKVTKLVWITSELPGRDLERSFEAHVTRPYGVSEMSAWAVGTEEA